MLRETAPVEFMLDERRVLVLKVEPVLIAEHLRRARGRAGGGGGTSPLLMSTDQLRRLLTDIITDTESDEFSTFCRLLRKLDTDRCTAGFLEALHLALTFATATCRCRCCLERRARHSEINDDEHDQLDTGCPSTWDVQVTNPWFAEIRPMFKSEIDPTSWMDPTQSTVHASKLICPTTERRLCRNCYHKF